MKKLLLILLCLPMIGFTSFPTNTNNPVQSVNNECDIVILKNGEEKLVKIIEITTKLIQYRDCSNQDGPLISIPKKDVVMIKYVNGKNEVITTSLSAWTPLKIVRAILLGILGCVAIFVLVMYIFDGSDAFFQ